MRSLCATRISRRAWCAHPASASTGATRVGQNSHATTVASMPTYACLSSQTFIVSRKLPGTHPHTGAVCAVSRGPPPPVDRYHRCAHSRGMRYYFFLGTQNIGWRMCRGKVKKFRFCRGFPRRFFAVISVALRPAPERPEKILQHSLAHICWYISRNNGRLGKDVEFFATKVMSKSYV